ncbi:MAG: hypothetical protein LBQ03_02365 [Puniceicoccales bacterium]|jgi:hypothetical protein|nr:hypothetical protein [Puniceicoccales bacterium]
MDEDTIYYRCHIGSNRKLQENEQFIEIVSAEDALNMDQWESSWEDEELSRY